MFIYPQGSPPFGSASVAIYAELDGVDLLALGQFDHIPQPLVSPGLLDGVFSIKISVAAGSVAMSFLPHAQADTVDALTGERHLTETVFPHAPADVPEPSSLALAGAAAIGLVLARRRGGSPRRALTSSGLLARR